MIPVGVIMEVRTTPMSPRQDVGECGLSQDKEMVITQIIQLLPSKSCHRLSSWPVGAISNDHCCPEHELASCTALSITQS